MHTTYTYANRLVKWHDSESSSTENCYPTLSRPLGGGTAILDFVLETFRDEVLLDNVYAFKAEVQ